MQISHVTAPVASIATPLLAIGVPDGQLEQALSVLDSSARERVLSAAREEEFSGKAGSSTQWPSFGAVAAGRLMLVGLGSGGTDEVLDRKSVV